MSRSAIFVLGVLGGVMALAGLNILKFLAYLREELTIVLATASSDAVLPQIMRKLERMGVKDSVVGLVIPTGYSFNLDAFSIYLTLAVVFIAQATNTPLSFGDLLLVLGVSLITSKGAHGVPGSAIVILAATLNAVPSIPAIGLVLVLSVDWFIGMARALGNLIGNCVATVVVAAWEGDLDRAKAAQGARRRRAGRRDGGVMPPFSHSNGGAAFHTPSSRRRGNAETRSGPRRPCRPRCDISGPAPRSVPDSRRGLRSRCECPSDIPCAQAR